ncbi:site-specific DNA-methyltransferase (adenine-specific) [Seinonella peptonophila]|uniref:Methyltransferase n=1 Tax=Seinonella peptonophila TaxID=112248 RepID=A0A1M5AX92_9BACL|nr:site-specific DNA-methyltransferase [Seinonella peptonophila]SHF34830.1 site-specific DNA-methyltransferase (adenine-specific) [Seinonella peptonophila]
MKKNHIYCIDNVAGLRQYTPDESIDLTVTSPPYDRLRKYHGYIFDFPNLARELYRVTKPGGVVVWIVADQTIEGTETGTSFRQALYFKKIGFLLHDTMIYQKRNPVPSNQMRYQSSFEYMFVFSKGRPNTFHPIKEPTKYGGKQEFHGRKRLANGQLVRYKNSGKPIKAMKVRCNVWTYNVGYQHSSRDQIAFEHPAIFPEALAADHILSWSNPGEVVLDPFIGSGTTAKMAILNNRYYVGFEVSREYVKIANKRMSSIK